MDKSRRDIAFARQVAQDILIETEKTVGAPPDSREEQPEAERCVWCCTRRQVKAHAPYCSDLCAIEAQES